MRYFDPVTTEQLRSRIESTLYESGKVSAYLIRKRLKSDLAIDFGFKYFHHANEPTDDLYGLLDYQRLETGLSFFGAYASGDEEHPVYFLVYWYKRLRIYIPKAGNPYNTTTKRAYGHDDVSDALNARKRWPVDFAGVRYADPADFDFSAAAIRQEIMMRLSLPPETVGVGKPPCNNRGAIPLLENRHGRQ